MIISNPMCVLNGGDGYQECHEVRAWSWGCRWAWQLKQERETKMKGGKTRKYGQRRKADQLAMLKFWWMRSASI